MSKKKRQICAKTQNILQEYSKYFFKIRSSYLKAAWTAGILLLLMAVAAIPIILQGYQDQSPQNIHSKYEELTLYLQVIALYFLLILKHFVNSALLS